MNQGITSPSLVTTPNIMMLNGCLVCINIGMSCGDRTITIVLWVHNLKLAEFFLIWEKNMNLNLSSNWHPNSLKSLNWSFQREYQTVLHAVFKFREKWIPSGSCFLYRQRPTNFTLLHSRQNRKQIKCISEIDYIKCKQFIHCIQYIYIKKFINIYKFSFLVGPKWEKRKYFKMNISTKRLVSFKELSILFLHTCMFPTCCFRQRTFSRNLLIFLLRCGTRPYKVCQSKCFSG